MSVVDPNFQSTILVSICDPPVIYKAAKLFLEPIVRLYIRNI
jgi:hypothetical protein